MSFRVSGLSVKIHFLKSCCSGSLSLLFKYHYTTKLKDGTRFIPQSGEEVPRSPGATAPGVFVGISLREEEEQEPRLRTPGYRSFRSHRAVRAERRSRPGLTGAVWETSPGLQQPKPRPRGPPPRGAEVGRCWGPTPGGAHRPSSPRPHPWLPPRMPTRLHPSRSPGAPAAPASRTVA